MSAPEKPWEVRKRNLIPQSVESQSFTSSSSRSPPAIPPRPSSLGSTGYGSGYGYNGSYLSRPYGTGFTGYNNYSYPGAGYSLGSVGSAYGGYGGYGGYRPLGTFGYNQDREPNAIVRQAEESTRSAFQSVESVVGAVGSIAMMLESTYFAVHSCFRALLGVAEHFSNIKNHIWEVISAIQLLRRLQYWLRRIMIFLRLRQFETSENAWDETVLSHSPSGHNTNRQRAWPTLMFFVVIFGIPWLMYKLITLLQSPSPAVVPNWASAGGNHVIGKTLYDFNSNKPDEISFTSGEELILAPSENQPRVRGWILAAKNNKIGLVPANYVEVLGRSTAAANDRKTLNSVLEVDQTD
ncbi:peroxisomal membrane protein PEX13-like [Dysidea avara]|uniref:peroxisomal membrane protein PEX13-like n=1 Tax=Dysidea avara TaxID=196820 RepID=UPI0033268ACA